MDLPQIGAHCSLSSCNALDFLPIACKCGKSFCANHSPLDRHACPLLNSSVVTSNDLPTFSEQTARCALAGCQKPSMQGNRDETCTACSMSFCIYHRHPESHQCSSLIAKKEEISSRLPKSLPKLSKPVRKQPPTDPIKLAQWQKMELMKMRHRATPVDPNDKTSSLPQEQRLHVKVMVGEAERIFWLRKTIVTGRALDLIVKELKLTFPDNQPLHFFMTSTVKDQPDTYLQNDQSLADQVADGCTLVLSTNSQVKEQ